MTTLADIVYAEDNVVDRSEGCGHEEDSIDGCVRCDDGQRMRDNEVAMLHLHRSPCVMWSFEPGVCAEGYALESISY